MLSPGWGVIMVLKSSKEGSTALTKPLSCLKRVDVTALLRAQNRYAIRMADHQRSHQIVRDGTAWGKGSFIIYN